MTPPQLHMHLEVWFSAGMFATSTVGEPGILWSGRDGNAGLRGKGAEGRSRCGCHHRIGR